MLQPLSLRNPKTNGNWNQIDASKLLLITQPQLCWKIQIGLLKVRLAVEVPAYCNYYFLCLSFQFSVYFMVSEMGVIWVIPCISNGNIDQKCFCICKSSSNLLSSKGSIFCISKCSFFERIFWNLNKHLIFFFFFVSKNAFCRLKVQTNGHLVSSKSKKLHVRLGSLLLCSFPSARICHRLGSLLLCLFPSATPELMRSLIEILIRGVWHLWLMVWKDMAYNHYYLTRVLLCTCHIMKRTHCPSRLQSRWYSD